jgi:hypothetical protein
VELEEEIMDFLINKEKRKKKKKQENYKESKSHNYNMVSTSLPNCFLMAYDNNEVIIVCHKENSVQSQETN